MMSDVVSTFVEVTLDHHEDFLKVAETLTRIGIYSKKDNILWQLCHILHKRGHYYIVHFKEMFILDGKHSTFDEYDCGRRNRIVTLLEEWKLLKVVDPDTIKDPIATMAGIKVISYKDKDAWNTEAKYNIGNNQTDK